MFIHQNRLETQLKPDHYRSEAQYRREIERLFVPAWHLVGTSAELPRDGARFPVGQAHGPDGEDEGQAGVLAPRTAEVEVLLVGIGLAMDDGRIADEQLGVGGLVGRDVARLQAMKFF